MKIIFRVSNKKLNVNSDFTFQESLFKLNKMQNLRWYDLELDACPSNEIVVFN